ncbi:MAG TPA: hypothetical protein VMV18_01810 [bacterium]|nr:hypothetical protein [bacterium]
MLFNARASFFESWETAALLVCPDCVRDFVGVRDGRLPTTEMALVETRRAIEAAAAADVARAWHVLERCAERAGRLEIGEIACDCCAHPSPRTVRGGELALCEACLAAAEHAAR